MPKEGLRTVAIRDMPPNLAGLDIGPVTVSQFAAALKGAKTVVWNGPLGKFEDEPFSKGTKFVAQAMANCAATTIVGGGETAEAVEAYNLDESMTHVSTGGGAFLEYVEGTPFKALQVIDDE